MYIMFSRVMLCFMLYFTKQGTLKTFTTVKDEGTYIVTTEPPLTVAVRLYCHRLVCVVYGSMRRAESKQCIANVTSSNLFYYTTSYECVL